MRNKNPRYSKETVLLIKIIPTYQSYKNSNIRVLSGLIPQTKLLIEFKSIDYTIALWDRNGKLKKSINR